MTIHASSQPVSPQRRRMLNDMAMRGMREATQRDYIRFVQSFAALLKRPPDTPSAEDIRRFQVYQTESGVQPPTINYSVSALRFFFTVTLDRPDLSRRLVLVRHPRMLPTVLSIEEVGRLHEMAPGAKYRAALGTACGAGLRVSGVAALKIGDIDSKRMLVRVEQGKGRKDRNAMLSPQLLSLLRLWWREGKRRRVMLPHGWLFPGRNALEPISTRQLDRGYAHETAEGPLASRSGSARTRCATALLRTCSSRMSTSALSRDQGPVCGPPWAKSGASRHAGQCGGDATVYAGSAQPDLCHLQSKRDRSLAAGKIPCRNNDPGRGDVSR